MGDARTVAVEEKRRARVVKVKCIVSKQLDTKNFLAEQRIISNKHLRGDTRGCSRKGGINE